MDFDSLDRLIVYWVIIPLTTKAFKIRFDPHCPGLGPDGGPPVIHLATSPAAHAGGPCATQRPMLKVAKIF